MADVKQILVVDDHFEMLEFLRSMLKMSNHEYEVLGVPSAEEGFLELRRTPFDLLITDVRLPGISGFELVRNVKRVRPDMPVIMITAYSSPEGKKEAAELEIFRYFQKPLDTEALLTAVHTALYGEPAGEQGTASGSLAPATVSMSEEVRNRIYTLRTDTGAAQVALAAADGTLLFDTGGRRDVDLGRLAQLVARNLENSLALADELRSEHPLMIHYQAGETVDLYSANVGRGYCLLLLFDVKARRGRIGTVWIFAQRAIKDLADMLPVAQSAAPLETAGATMEAASRAFAQKNSQTEKGERDKEKPSQAAGPLSSTATGPEAARGPEVVAEPVVEVEPEQPPEIDEEAFLAALLEATDVEVEVDTLPERLAEVDEVDLDAFWDEALSEEDGGVMSGLSLDEARERGLLPPEFNIIEED